MSSHVLNRDDIELSQLAAELSERLGRTLALSARLPSDSAEGGPGFLAVTDAGTGEEVEVPDAQVRAALRVHVPARPAEPIDRLAESLAGAETVAELRGALAAYADAERAARDRRRAQPPGRQRP